MGEPVNVFSSGCFFVSLLLFVSLFLIFPFLSLFLFAFLPFFQNPFLLSFFPLVFFCVSFFLFLVCICIPLFTFCSLHCSVFTSGFFHEQARDDRDQFVEIKWENILDGKETYYNSKGELNLVHCLCQSFLLKVSFVCDLLNTPLEYISNSTYKL